MRARRRPVLGIARRDGLYPSREPLGEPMRLGRKEKKGHVMRQFVRHRLPVGGKAHEGKHDVRPIQVRVPVVPSRSSPSHAAKFRRTGESDDALPPRQGGRTAQQREDLLREVVLERLHQGRKSRSGRVRVDDEMRRFDLMPLSAPLRRAVERLPRGGGGAGGQKECERESHPRTVAEDGNGSYQPRAALPVVGSTRPLRREKRRAMPTKPAGSNAAMSMMSRPYTTRSRLLPLAPSASRVASERGMRTAAPRSGPTTVPTPPSTATRQIWMESDSGRTEPGSMKRTYCA